jgi:hypothetical protein
LELSGATSLASQKRRQCPFERTLHKYQPQQVEANQAPAHRLTDAINSPDFYRDHFTMNPLAPFLQRTRIAYFSMEIGLRQEVHTYAGGSAFWPAIPPARAPI